MHVELYKDSKCGSAHAGFREWQDRVPDGYYLNRRSTEEYMLHRTSCGHLDDKIRSTTRTLKVCAPSTADLEDWATLSLAEVVPCTTCSP